MRRARFVRLVLLSVVALAAAACTSTATRPSVNREKFQRFLASDVHTVLAARAISRIPEQVLRRCPALKVHGSRVGLLRPVGSFNKDGVPNDGAWKEVYPVSGCGDDVQLNVFFIVRPGPKIDTVIGVPGSTRAGLRLQTDAIAYALIGPRALAKTCQHFQIQNTRFEDFGLHDPRMSDPGPGTANRPWWETWTVIGCSRTFDVPINFVPDENGTTITQDVAAVVERTAI